MATGPVDILEPLEDEETGKKKSKFQTFKNFFAKKKKKREPSSPGAESTLKPSHSSGDISTPHLNASMLHLPAEPGSKGIMGNKALSHDSVFIFESPPVTACKTSSQENLQGKVKALQLQFQQTLHLRSPPIGIASKKTEDAGAISEDDGLPRSPPEISSLHDVLTSSTSKPSNPVQRHSSLSLGGTDSEDDQEPSEASSRLVGPLSPSVFVSPTPSMCHLLSVDFNTPATPLGCLDTSAARHKITLNPRKQKVYNNKTQALAVEKLEKEPGLLQATKSKVNSPKLLEEIDHPEEDSEGPSVQNTYNLNEIWINNSVPKTRTSNPLRYSWNFLPGPGGTCVSAPKDCNTAETDTPNFVVMSSPNAESSFEEMEPKVEEGVEIAQYHVDGLKQNAQSPEKEEFEISEPLQAGTKAVMLCDMLFSVSHGNDIQKDLDLPAKCIQVQRPKCIDQKLESSGTGSNKVQLAGAKEKPACEHSWVSLGSDSQLYIPQFSSSASKTPSEARISLVSECEKCSAIRNDTADAEHQPSENHMKPVTSPQEELAMLDSSLDSTEDKKLHLPTEFCCSVWNKDLGNQETELLKKACDSTVKDEIASESTPPNEDAKEDHSGGIKAKESRPPSEIVKTQLKSSSTKPVRFTIAPAWQRSLSGGSNSLDGSCSRSSPSSPVKPEFFEGIPDTATLGCIPNSPERLDGANRNTWAIEETWNCESPFGVKLRRTASLLKYHADQQHHEPPKLSPLAASTPSSAKDEPKSSGPRKPPQSLTSTAKSLVTKSSLQEEKNTSKAKPEEVAAKQQMSMLPEKILPVHLETPPSKPDWLSMARLKQRGFPLAEELKKEDKALAQTEPGEEKNVGNLKPEKHQDAPSDNLLENSSIPLVCARENKAQMKMPMSSPTASIRMVSQDATFMEKEIRTSSSLPTSLCNPAEPPWLFLAKKKAKAWSEMPQMVQ
ncbi:acrosomal protein KIAA1210 homolog isoform X2 [Paroedura picta]